MDTSAVEQAMKRLAKAEKSAMDLANATNLDDAEEAWTDFLIAVSTIYSKLEQGAKGSPKSEPWYGKKKKERKSDPLLRYLHFARNSNEHGIERISSVTPPNWDVDNAPLKFNERRQYKAQFIDKTTKEPTGNLIDVVIAGPTLKPIKVTDSRFNDECDPPTTHLGNEIEFADFIDKLAHAAMPYFRNMLQEAETLSSIHSKIIAK